MPSRVFDLAASAKRSYSQAYHVVTVVRISFKKVTGTFSKLLKLS